METGYGGAHPESQHSQHPKGRGRRIAISLRLVYLTQSQFHDNLGFIARPVSKYKINQKRWRKCPYILARKLDPNYR